MTTLRPRHASELARFALKEGAQRLIALGGDGTLSEVIAGVVSANVRPGDVVVGHLPYGTGGDFSRMLEGGRDFDTILAQLDQYDAHLMDVGIIRCLDHTGRMIQRVFLNETSVGMTAETVRLVSTGQRNLLGPYVYLANGMWSSFRHRAPLVRVKVDGQTVGEYRLNSAMVSNGRFSGGGMSFAPNATVDDELLDLTVVEETGIPSQARGIRALYQGDFTKYPWVHTFRGTQVHITPITDGSRQVEADGDLVGQLPLFASVMPGAIRMLGLRPEVLSLGTPDTGS